MPRLPARLRGRPCPEGAPGGTFGSIPQDWDLISKIRAHHLMRRNELSHASAKPTTLRTMACPLSAPPISQRFYHPSPVKWTWSDINFISFNSE